MWQFLLASSYISIFCRTFLAFNCFLIANFGLMWVLNFYKCDFLWVSFTLSEHLLRKYFLLHFGSEGVKNHIIKKISFFYRPPTNLQQKIIHLSNYALLHTTTFNRNKLKVWKFQRPRLISFSAIKKTVSGVKEWSNFVL